MQSSASSAYDRPPPGGDHGFFGPQSVAWRVHGDFTTMMIGGVSALLLQMLHPSALAGVWDHSDFRRDMSGRLRRTATFLGGTTYGSTAQALELIARVRAIHDRVSGTLPDGRPYSANDPELLTWVHIAGTWCFLSSYLRYGPGLSPVEQDRYFEETAVIAQHLGASAVPTSLRQVQQYLSDMLPLLNADRRTQIVAGILLAQRAPNLSLEPFAQLVMHAGTKLLPPWAARMHGFRGGPPAFAIHAAVKATRNVTAWALNSPAR